MKGTLTGLVLAVTPTATGPQVKLAGITDNGHHGVTWIRDVTFAASRLPTPPAVGSAVRVECLAAYESWAVPGGTASRVTVVGVSCEQIDRGRTVQKGEATFLADAVNAFTFAGHLTKDALTKRAPVVEGRIAVKGKKGTHYFNLEAWRDQMGVLDRLRSGAEVEVTCLLRRDLLPTRDGHGPRTLDVMEVRAGYRLAAPSPAATRPLNSGPVTPSTPRPDRAPASHSFVTTRVPQAAD